MLGATSGSAAFRARAYATRAVPGRLVGDDVHHVLVLVVMTMQPEAFRQAIPAEQPDINGGYVQPVEDRRHRGGGAAPSDHLRLTRVFPLSSSRP